MSELKTKANKASVTQFINTIEDPVKQQDCKTLLNIISKITGSEPVMWGSSIIGYGNYHYKYVSGREGDWFVTGFSPRKQSLTIYLTAGIKDPDLFEKLGKHKTGKGCLYIKRLADVDQEILKQIISNSVTRLK